MALPPNILIFAGVRQGCPLSGILFVIGVEILRNAIKRSREIEGIQIDPNHSIN